MVTHAMYFGPAIRICARGFRDLAISAVTIAPPQQLIAPVGIVGVVRKKQMNVHWGQL